MRIATKDLILSLLILSLYPLSLTARPFVFILSQDDLKDATPSSYDSPPDPTTPHYSSEWDEFGSESDSPHKSEDELDPGSWRLIFDMKRRGLKTKEVAGSVLSPSGNDPIHDGSNTSDANSTLYNSYGAPNPSSADGYNDFINRSDPKGDGNPLRQLEYIWLIFCIWYLFS